MADNLEKIITKVEYIISVSESPHPADTYQRKIKLMVGHARDALINLQELKKEKNEQKEI